MTSPTLIIPLSGPFSILAIQTSSVTSKSTWALSVSIQAKLYPSETLSPNLTFHYMIFPSVIVGEMAGSFKGIFPNAFMVFLITLVNRIIIILNLVS